MAKKRKAPKNFEERKSTKATKYDAEERFDDSEDEFYAGREKILLEENADLKRRRRLIEQEKYLEPSDEEILGYQDDETDEDEDEEQTNASQDEDGTKYGMLQRSKVNRKLSPKYHGDNAEDEESSEEEHWGTNRSDYYNADIIETEADALEEEKEAKRLHQKQVKGMTEADFGFDETEWIGEKSEARQLKSYTEKLPEAQIPQDATDQQRLQILRSRYPELQHLAEDFLHLRSLKEELDMQCEQTARQIAKGRELGDGLPATIKRDALTAYLAAISLYFVVLSSEVNGADVQSINAMPPLELHEHSIIQTLTRARELWDHVADEDTAALKSLPNTTAPNVPQTSKPQVNGHKSVVVSAKPPKKQASDSKKPRKLDEQDLDEEYIDLSKIQLGQKKKKTSKPRKLLEIDELIRAANAEEVDSDSDFGDERPLTEEQYAEKDRKRKSLRFYTSQIASKANKRGIASREAGGDDDLPYRERQRDRQERLMKAAEARGNDGADTFSDDGEGDELGEELPLQARPDVNDEYYDTVLNAAARKKADKKAKAEAYTVAARNGAEVYEEETVGADGKRAITYAIAKNKGLAPKRKKEVRNPRVKKRKKFDEKMKKLSSVRQVYKGGEGRGGYGGELTGIKTNIVKSVKL